MQPSKLRTRSVLLVVFTVAGVVLALCSVRMGSGYIANYFLEDAVHKQNVRSTDLALFLGADPCLENEYQVSILARATYGNIEIVRILLQHGADPDIRDYLGRPAIDSVEDPHIVALLQQAMKDRKKKEHKQ